MVFSWTTTNQDKLKWNEFKMKWKLIKKKKTEKQKIIKPKPVKIRTWPVNMFNNGSKKNSIFFFNLIAKYLLWLFNFFFYFFSIWNFFSSLSMNDSRNQRKKRFIYWLQLLHTEYFIKKLNNNIDKLIREHKTQNK